MSHLIELRDKRNKLMNDATAFLRAGITTTEQRTQFDSMMADVDAFEADIQREERIANFEAEQRASTRPIANQPGAGSEDEIRSAFRQYVRTGERRAVLTSNDGGVLIPPAFYSTLTVAQKAWGQIVGAVNNRMTGTGATMSIALANDTGNDLTLLTENTAAPDVDPAFTSISSVVETYTTGEVVVTNQELEDSFFDLQGFISDRFGERYYRGLSRLITNGSTSGAVASLLNGATVGATSSAPTAIAYADVAALFGSLNAAYLPNAKWSLSSASRAAMLAVVDSLGRPLYVPAPSSDAFDTLLGKPIVLNEYMPSIAASNKPLLFGDFKQGYTLRTVGEQGIAIRRANELYVKQNAVAFYGFCRFSGFSTDAGTHPIMALQQHS